MAVNMEEDYDYARLRVLRGPALVTGVLLTSVVIPLLSEASLKTLIQAILVLVGSVLFLCDAAELVKEQLRLTASRWIDSIILDDILKYIYDPQTGLIATVVGTFVGNGLVYTLPLTAAQRAALFRAFLPAPPSDTLMNEDQWSRKILQEPGGLKYVLPIAAQSWLAEEAKDGCIVQNDTGRHDSFAATTAAVHAVPAIDTTFDQNSQESSNDSVTDLYNEEKFNIRYRREFPGNEDDLLEEPFHRNNPRVDVDKTTRINSATPFTTSTIPPSTTQGLLPQHILFSVFRDLFFQSARNLTESIPDGTVETVGVATFLLIFLQLRYSRRARAILGNVVQGSTTLGLSSMLLSSTVVLAIKYGMLWKPESPYLGSQRLAPALHCLSVQSMLVAIPLAAQKIVKVAARTGIRQWKGLLAVLVMVYFGRRSGTRVEQRRRMRR